MNTLTMETSSIHLLLLLEVNNKKFKYEQESGLRHSEDLMPSILFLLQRAGIKASELDLIICSKGPGSFTGLRIGVSTAKGLASGSNASLVTIPTLDIWGKDPSFPKDSLIVPVIDAKKNQFFAGFYLNQQLLLDYVDMSPELIMSKLKDYKNVIITGYNAPLFMEKTQKKEGIILDENWNNSRIELLSNLGKIWLEEKGIDKDNEGPIYLRKSEAEIALLSNNLIK